MDMQNEDVLAEIGDSVRAVDEAELDAFADAIVSAGRIALYGVGREGLQMRALAMRLYHLGLDAHVVGDMTTPPLGDGDLLVVSAGPGAFSTVSALIGTAQDAGARTACVTSVPGGTSAAAVDLRLVIPAQTMAQDSGGEVSALPMGSLFEVAQFVTFELLVKRLMTMLDVNFARMRGRHTNLE